MNESVNLVDELLIKYGVNDDQAACVFHTWAREQSLSANSTEKVLWATESKVVEYLFCLESQEWDLGYHFEFNFNSQFDHDIWLCKSKYNWIPVDYKRQAVTLHPYKFNPFNIHAGNLCTLRKDKMARMCRESLPLIVIDRDIRLSRPCNAKAAEFKEKFRWYEKDFELRDSRHLIIIEVSRLCEMVEKKDQILELTIPEKLRHERNGKHFDGITYNFSMELFDTTDISEYQKTT